jgi:hypothetical protein
MSDIKKRTLEKIHFYNVKENQGTADAWIHYISSVYPGLDMRVLDSVTTIEDVAFDREGTILGIAESSFDELDAKSQRDSRRGLRFAALKREAIEIVNAAPTWLNNIMMYSPLRDHDAWASHGKAQYLADLKKRQEAFSAKKDK